MNIVQFFKEAKGETKKVAWPSRQQIIHHTIAVIAFSLVVGAILGTFDFLFARILEKFIL